MDREAPDDDVAYIGVDGGASEVKAHEVLVARNGAGPSLSLGAGTASCCYDTLPGFTPVDVAEQIAALEKGAVRPTNAERTAALAWIEAAARTIASVATESRRARVKIGMCMPGIKTPDRRGIAVLRHGPRMPDFLDRLEERLARETFTFDRPIAPLIGDGDACGLGEELDARGALRDVADAYYIGGGTGVAESLKLAGSLVSFDDLRGSLAKAWELTTEAGESFESAISTGGINATYAARSGEPLPLLPAEFPEERALRGDRVADEVMSQSAEALAELVFRRLVEVRRGAAGAPRLLERIVLGQHLARLFARPELATVFRERVETGLARRIHAGDDRVMKSRYLDGTTLSGNLLRASSLRAAPALGAAAAALGIRARHPRAGATDDRDARSPSGLT